MDAYDRCTNLGEKNPAHVIAIYGRGRDRFRPPTYRTIILPVVFYGFETWSLTLRDERGQRVFENKVLR
jgi:hypothetical protein